MAVMVPIRSPSSQAQQLEKLSQCPFVAYCRQRERVNAGFRVDFAKGANDRAMKQKMMTLMYPVSQFSMNVVLGFESSRMKQMKMNTPIPSFKITLQMSPQANMSSLCMGLPKNQLQNNPATAPVSCAKRQMGSSVGRYLFYVLRQLATVTNGLILAPQS